MLAKDIMTKKVFSITPETSIGDAINVLVKKAISGAPVLDSENNIVGIITEKDLLVAFDFSQRIDVPVKDFMSKEIVEVAGDMSVEDISRLLVQKNIKRVPILKDKKVVGIVSRRDILRHVVQANGGSDA